MYPLEQVPHGRHGFAVYDDPTEQLSTAVPFIRGGLARRDRCFYVYDGVPLSEVRRALRLCGIDTAGEQRRGALVLLAPGEWVPPGCSPESALELIACRVEEAITAGFAGVHAALEKSWMASEGFGPDWERACEVLSTSRLHLLAMSIVCLFDRRRLPPDLLVDVYRLHPWMAFRGDVRPNLFYEPPEHLLRPPTLEARAAWMHDQLTRLYISEQALRQREQELRALVENAPDTVIHFDRDLRLTYINPAGERLRGLPAAELLGKTTQEAGFAASRTPGWELALRQVLRTGCELTVEVPGRLPSGEVGTYQARLTPVIGPDGSVESVLTIARDVSDRRQAEQERERLYQELMGREQRLRAMVEEILVRQTIERRKTEAAVELQQVTPRERDILRLLATGRTNQQIGREIGLTTGTVRNYVSRLLTKLGAVDRTQAAVFATEWGLLD